MSWMAKWPGAHPVFVQQANGARFTDIDGNTYVDFCLGDTGSMTGHSPDATVAAVREQVGKGITAMLPTEDAAIVSGLLRERFGLPLWQFTVSATDANRHVIRYSRMITGRSKIIVIDRCYHGSVDETFATLDDAGFNGAWCWTYSDAVRLNLMKKGMIVLVESHQNSKQRAWVVVTKR